MPACKVYRFEYHDHLTGTWVLATDYALARAIAEIRARMVEGTEKIVDDSCVARSGYLISESGVR